MERHIEDVHCPPHWQSEEDVFHFYGFKKTMLFLFWFLFSLQGSSLQAEISQSCSVIWSVESLAPTLPTAFINWSCCFFPPLKKQKKDSGSVGLIFGVDSSTFDFILVSVDQWVYGSDKTIYRVFLWFVVLEEQLSQCDSPKWKKRRYICFFFTKTTLREHLSTLDLAFSGGLKIRKL